MRDERDAREDREEYPHRRVTTEVSDAAAWYAITHAISREQMLTIYDAKLRELAAEENQ